MNILTIGGATQDILLQYDDADFMTISQRKGSQSYLLFEAGEKIEVDSLINLTGGGATNVAVSFSRQGFKTTCVCSIGNDHAGKQITDDLQQEHVCIDHLTKSATMSTGMSYIITSQHNDRTIFTYRGANTQLSITDIKEEIVAGASYIYITSLSGKASEHLTAITKLAKKHAIPVAINPGKSQLAKKPEQLLAALPYVDVLILNSSEAKLLMTTLIQQTKDFHRAFTSTSSSNPCALNQQDNTAYLLAQPIACQDMFFSLAQFFTTMLGLGPQIVAVTNGANGVYVADKKTVYFHPSIRTNVVNTVGAGDAFGSAFIGSLIKQKTIPEALIRGIINSASVLSHVGAKAGLLTTSALETKALERSSTTQTFNLSICHD